jgi:predicted CoA-binding protein
LLRGAETILVIDWPSKDVPESLALAGFHVVVRGGHGPADYSVYELHGGAVEVRHLSHAPERADLVYSYRPPGELAGIVATASSVGAKAVWVQTSPAWSAEDLAVARRLVESSGLIYLDEPDIVGAARGIVASKQAMNKE